MAECKECGGPAVMKNPAYCRKHFIEYFEKKVEDTIKEHSLLKPGDKVAVGCSGGKDSTSLLYLLKKFHGDVTALAIDEGISGYRDLSLRHLEEFCKEKNVKLEIYSFEDAFGKSLDDMDTKAVGGMPCTTCGTFRRYLMNKESKGFDKIAVGHNMDDEAQSVLMNLFKGQTYLLSRTGPITKDIDGMTQRIKPLYFMKEKEIATYAFLMGFMDTFVECPNAHLAYRICLRDLLNEYESINPGTKENILRKHLEIAGRMKKEERGSPGKCRECGEPASGNVCKACRIKVKI